MMGQSLTLMTALLSRRAGGSAPPPSLPLDGLTAVAAWSSGRRLRTAYTGSLIRVRRSTDNAEINIGYTASNALDVPALLTFVGAGDGFVTTIYDQTGAGRNATQTTAANQGRIVVSGALNTIGAKPAVLGNGTSTSYIIANAAVQAINAVVRPSVDGGGTGFRMISNSSPAGGGAMLLSNTTSAGRWGTYGAGGPRPATSLLLANNSYVLTLSGGSFSANGAADGTYAATEGQNVGTIFSGVGLFFTGSIGEVTWFASALSAADRQSLETDQNAYWRSRFTADSTAFTADSTTITADRT